MKKDGCDPGYTRDKKWRCVKKQKVDKTVKEIDRDISIRYKGRPIDMDMLNTVLQSFSQDLTISQLRDVINIRTIKDDVEEK